MTSGKPSLKLPDRAEWVLLRRADVKIERRKEPTVLSLEQAVEWIRAERPIIWTGSIFSVPEPASFPSGLAIATSLFSLILEGAVPRAQQEPLIAQLIRRWPLEALLDEFEFLGFDLAESLLRFFADHNEEAAPSALHQAVVSYYQAGLSKAPLIVTSNWDTLQERAFADAGWDVVPGGPGWKLDRDFGRPAPTAKTMFVFHPHGSFGRGDVVCSYRREQRQLSMNPVLLRHPTLFLGYSGYEPSLYFQLEHDAGQLWCVRNHDDFLTPAKRRLLCRPNVVVYIGDLRDLLRAAGVLDHDVDLNGKLLALREDIPAKVREVLQQRVLCSLAPGPCAAMLIHTLLSPLPEPEGTLRYVALMKTLVEHMRDRHPDTAILGAFLASAHFRDSEQLWVSILAHLLRHDTDVPMETIQKVIAHSKRAPSSGLHKAKSPEDLHVYGFGSCKQRANFYKRYLGLLRPATRRRAETKTVSFDDVTVSAVSALISGDVAALGEFVEILAFEQLRVPSLEKASSYFDYAATCFYLRGLWNAGSLNEWAASHPDEISPIAGGRTLLIPTQPELAARRARGLASP